jgi:hypothetical protein
MNADLLLSEGRIETQADRDYGLALETLRGHDPECANALDDAIGRRLLERHSRTARLLGHESSADAFPEPDDDPVTSAEIIVALEATYAALDEDLDDGAC